MIVTRKRFLSWRIAYAAELIYIKYADVLQLKRNVNGEIWRAY